MIRTYIDIEGIIHNYKYDKDKMISKAKCINRHKKKMNYIFANNLGKHIKLGFICFECNVICISNKFSIYKCKISIKPIKRLKD